MRAAGSAGRSPSLPRLLLLCGAARGSLVGTWVPPPRARNPVSKGALLAEHAMLSRRRTLTSMSASMGNDRATAASASTEDDSLVVGAPLSLNVSSPALLLNHMAERYVSTSRILMEFVDNSLDDAENFFDHETGAYMRAAVCRACAPCST